MVPVRVSRQLDQWGCVRLADASHYVFAQDWTHLLESDLNAPPTLTLDDLQGILSQNDIQSLLALVPAKHEDELQLDEPINEYPGSARKKKPLKNKIRRQPAKMQREGRAKKRVPREKARADKIAKEDAAFRAAERDVKAPRQVRQAALPWREQAEFQPPPRRSRDRTDRIGEIIYGPWPSGR